MNIIKEFSDLSYNEKFALHELSDQIGELKIVSSKARFMIEELYQFYFSGDGTDAFVNDARVARELKYNNAQMLIEIAVDYVQKVDQVIANAEHLADQTFNPVAHED